MDITNWAMGSNVPQWPLDENGEREKAVLLKDALDNLSDADMTVSFLAAYGIPCFKHYAHEGGAGKVINGFSGYGAGLYVPASLLDEANALLEAKPIEE